MTVEEFLEKAKIGLKRYYCDELGLSDWEERVGRRINEEHEVSLDEIKKIEEYTGLIKGKKILSVGSGWGGFVVAANKMGAKAFGIEPDEEKAVISKLRGEYQGVENSFYMGKGEFLPFKDNTYDIVECVSVLEHVDNPKMVIKEMIRVLKPGGCLYIHAPNYLYPTEPHYKIYWIPLLPKPLAKLYLRLLGRNSKFIEHINYITPLFISKILAEFEHINVTNIAISPKLGIKGAKTLKSKIKRILWNLIVKIYGFLGMDRPIELLIRKNM